MATNAELQRQVDDLTTQLAEADAKLAAKDGEVKTLTIDATQLVEQIDAMRAELDAKAVSFAADAPQRGGFVAKALG